MRAKSEYFIKERKGKTLFVAKKERKRLTFYVRKRALLHSHQVQMKATSLFPQISSFFNDCLPSENRSFARCRWKERRRLLSSLVCGVLNGPSARRRRLLFPP